ncbi:NAD(P)H-dependent oxidoreductase [Rhizobium sp. CFBP 8762]|uniref:FMN-dependent NADH-azoreductase n=1 Tax=Rhizobium sp. CFBP 8762 TaxID=2775279 RepID=UPI0017815D8D|nr:NAD(P)H-dependent oxidoreductase [Rhizobium sp. CFBP 8762]MBD8553847.1 NAD(P)H-dependent oxidoreductase [Rhizobium sp. CFBP 8762]
MKLLHIDSAITGESSVSRRLTADVTSRLRQAHPDIEVWYRDLAAEPLDHLTLADMPAPGESTAVLDQFLAADVVVIGAPMYNFTLSTQLKAWIDRILVAGKTFRYSETGPVGLVPEKRIIIAVSRGDRYGVGTPSAPAEHLETYLRVVFGFIGVSPEFVIAEGMLIGPEARDAAIDNAEQAVAALAV